MDFIENLSKKLANRIKRGPHPYKDRIESIRKSIQDIGDDSDKIKVLLICLDQTTLSLLTHQRSCVSPNGCQTDEAYSGLQYFLRQDLANLNVVMDQDTFTLDQRNLANTKIDDLQDEIKKLGLGQQIIFENIEEVKELYYYGKKRWFQIVIGKLTEMALAGVIAETASKKLIVIFAHSLTFLPRVLSEGVAKLS